MSEHEYVTKSGRVLTDEDIQKLADEAEAGYDVEHLKVKNMSKSVELIISEGVQLVKSLEQALSRERGGGTPLTRKAYLALREDALTWIRQNDNT